MMCGSPCPTNTVRFTAKDRDAETGLDYFGARYMSAAQGRWASADPINLTDARLGSPTSTLNKYAYAASNPLKYIDPDGKDIVVFYAPSSPTGHVMLAAFNQDTGDFAFLSVGPIERDISSIARNLKSGVPGTTVYDLPQSADQLRESFAALTIETNPEEAQAAIAAIRNGAGTGNWALLGNNCTSSTANVLREAGINPGPSGIAWQPRFLWRNLFERYSSPSQHKHSRAVYRGEILTSPVIGSQPGVDYGSPRFGISTFDWIMLMMRSELKACVAVSDSATGTSSSQCY